ncbi:16S rRNA (guanine(527)-N(7))-methyltransferase RsmG [Stomatohabitans albus]|uniref:16S rRNA (guanine(527)-N(7))-methyltransferase RsmG n=1 Tax=Stomatohabitans albus TaxID=3110766 RepID=UPI00300D0302
MQDQTRQRLDRLATLIAESPHNLVSARDRELVATHHIPECVAVCTQLKPGAHTHWIDLGTGGGLPGLVCAIMFPLVGWTLIDATAKKIDAVNGFIDDLELENARGVVGRAEHLARDTDYRGVYDGVISRAVARLDVVTELARGFVHPGGQIVVIKGPGLVQERGYMQRCAGQLKVHEKGTVILGPSDRQSHVITIIADGPVPEMIPRKDGVPASKPLGGPRTVYSPKERS